MLGDGALPGGAERYVSMSLADEPNFGKSDFMPGDQVFIDVLRWPDEKIAIESTSGKIGLSQEKLPAEQSDNLQFVHADTARLTHAAHDGMLTSWQNSLRA